MGSLVGRIAEETPPHTVLRAATGSDPVEIRSYPSILICETTFGPNGGLNRGEGEFGRLAKYIGVFSRPNNEPSEGIAMTAPVLMSRPTALEGSERPAEGRTMAFVLPASKYKQLSEVPAPTDPRVLVREVLPRTVAVHTFSGRLQESAVQERIESLLEAVRADQRWVVASDPAEWYCAGYNAPYVPSCLKTNEVMVVVHERSKT